MDEKFIAVWVSIISLQISQRKLKLDRHVLLHLELILRVRLWRTLHRHTRSEGLRTVNVDSLETDTGIRGTEYNSDVVEQWLPNRTRPWISGILLSMNLTNNTSCSKMFDQLLSHMTRIITSVRYAIRINFSYLSSKFTVVCIGKQLHISFF